MPSTILTRHALLCDSSPLSYGGADHFMVAGIPTWSLNRLINFDSEFGVAFESMPEIKNMRLLHVSRNMFRQDNVTGLPMPTGFHPISSKQIHRWQVREGRRERAREREVCERGRWEGASASQRGTGGWVEEMEDKISFVAGR